MLTVTVIQYMWLRDARKGQYGSVVLLNSSPSTSPRSIRATKITAVLDGFGINALIFGTFYIKNKNCHYAH